ncbi:hypothetical protein Tco_0911884 [Tanacetum coccineum]
MMPSPLSQNKSKILCIIFLACKKLITKTKKPPFNLCKLKWVNWKKLFKRGHHVCYRATQTPPVQSYVINYFDIEEKSSGSTTTRSDYSLPDYDAFYFDDNHFEEKSSGSTTTHFDFSLPEYASFHFDLSIESLFLCR